MPRAPRRQARAWCQVGSVSRRATARGGCSLSWSPVPLGPRPQLYSGGVTGGPRAASVPSLQGAPLSPSTSGPPAAPRHAACGWVLGTAPRLPEVALCCLSKLLRGLPGSGGTVGHVSRASLAVQGSGGRGADPKHPGCELSAPRAGQSPQGQPRAGSSADWPRCRSTPRRGCDHSRSRGGGWAPARQWRPLQW